jgi:hypothetical protein
MIELSTILIILADISSRPCLLPIVSLCDAQIKPHRLAADAINTPSCTPAHPNQCDLSLQTSATKRSSESGPRRGSRTTPRRVTTVQQLHFPDKENTLPPCCEPSRQCAFCAVPGNERVHFMRRRETTQLCMNWSLSFGVFAGMPRHGVPTVATLSRLSAVAAVVAFPVQVTGACCGSSYDDTRNNTLHNTASRLCGDTLPKYPSINHR